MVIIRKEMNGSKIHFASIKHKKKKRSLFKKLRETKDELRKSKVFEDL